VTDVASTPAVDAALRYFTAIGRQDLDAAVACWKEGGIDHLAPVGELRAPDGIRGYFASLFAAFPDFTYEVRDVIAEGDKVVVWWRITGTFTGAAFDGVRATGTAAEIDGLDYVRIEDGLIVRNDSYWDDSSVARQLGLLPARGSRQERALKGMLNLRTRVTRRRR
jgi:steroid delta-isomerase-like uncharacterized protein